jgi:hypothetical protein
MVQMTVDYARLGFFYMDDLSDPTNGCSKLCGNFIVHAGVIFLAVLYPQGSSVSINLFSFSTS